MDNLIVNYSCSILLCPNNFTHLCYDCPYLTQWCPSHALKHSIDTQHKNIKEKYLNLCMQAKKLLTINLVKCIENIKKIRQEVIISTKNLHKRISSLSETTLSKFGKLIKSFKDFIVEINKSETFEADYAEKISKCTSIESKISNIDIGINDISKFYKNTNEKLENFNIKKPDNSPNVVLNQRLSHSYSLPMTSSNYNNKVSSMPVGLNPKTLIEQFSSFNKVEVMW